jgi:hypothetical protein
MTEKKRNWFAKHKIATGITALAIVGVIGMASSSSKTPVTSMANFINNDYRIK